MGQCMNIYICIHSWFNLTFVKTNYKIRQILYHLSHWECPTLITLLRVMHFEVLVYFQRYQDSFHLFSSFWKFIIWKEKNQLNQLNQKNQSNHFNWLLKYTLGLHGAALFICTILKTNYFVCL